MTRIQPGSIVVAVDGSDHGDRAVQWAAEQAFVERRGLAVVSVAPDEAPIVTAGLGAPQPYPVETSHSSAVATADAAETLARQHRPGLAVERLGLLGEPRHVLVDLSADAALLVLGSHGRGSVRSKLQGPVGASVSKHAFCPVVVCRPGTELMVKQGVLLGADGAHDSLPVIDFAFRQASLRDQPLTVLHCYEGPTTETDGPGLELSETLAGFRERYPEINVSTRLTRGRPVDCLTVSSERWNLVVVGRRAAESLSRRVGGTVSTAVLERSRSAVAVVPQAKPAA